MLILWMGSMCNVLAKYILSSRVIVHTSQIDRWIDGPIDRRSWLNRLRMCRKKISSKDTLQIIYSLCSYKAVGNKIPNRSLYPKLKVWHNYTCNSIERICNPIQPWYLKITHTHIMIFFLRWYFATCLSGHTVKSGNTLFSSI